MSLAELIWDFPVPLFDSHFHFLHLVERLGVDESYLTLAREHGLVGALDVAVDEQNFHRRVDIAKKHSWLILSAGIHPSSVSDENWDMRWNHIQSQAEHPLVRAIGETGLDYFRDTSHRNRQIEAFQAHLELASRLRKPVIVHNRMADVDVLSCIRNQPGVQGVFHCFSSDKEVAKRALNCDFALSFAGNLTYKKSQNIRAAAAYVPDERILIETDAPYLPPQGFRGHTNHSGYLGNTFAMLCEVRGQAPETLGRILVENAGSLFRVSSEELE